MGKHAYFGGLFNLDEFDQEEADYAVFDDINGGFGFFPSYKQWLGGQFEFTATDKYRHKQMITWGKACIYICNLDPRNEWYKPGTTPDFTWMEENCTFYEVTHRVFIKT